MVDGVDPAQTWPAWVENIQRWSEGTTRVGFARIFDRHLARPALLKRLATLEDTERRLTNYRHLSELLHAASTEQALGPHGLLRWVTEGRAREADGELLELRLESDARAVRIVTLHTSKGLQYPFAVSYTHLRAHET